MRRSGYVTWYPMLLFLSVLLLAVTACGSDTPVPTDLTPEVGVVVFATEEPTSTPNTTSSPTPAATVGVGVQRKNVTSDSSSDDLSSANPRRPQSDENPLTGLKVDDQALIHRRPLMVRVGNDPTARPQVALNKADIVYEELVEWWITRFTAIYLGQDPEMIAPIRSARLINVQLTPQYQGVLASSGGSDPVRWELSQSDLINMDEFFAPKPYFYRENESWQTRLAFDATIARDYLLDEGLESDVNLEGFVFSQSLNPSTLPADAVEDAEEVIVPYPPQTSEAKWQYDPDSGKYLRSTAGEPMEAFDGSQIAATNVIIYFAEHQETDIVEDTQGSTSIRIIVNGLGTAWLVRDGKVLKGNWQTDGREIPEFIFNNGQPMPLKPGNTWIEVVPPDFVIEIDGVEHARLGDTAPEETGEATEEAVDEPTVTPTLTSTPIGARPDRTPTAIEVP